MKTENCHQHCNTEMRSLAIISSTKFIEIPILKWNNMNSFSDLFLASSIRINSMILMMAIVRFELNYYFMSELDIGWPIWTTRAVQISVGCGCADEISRDAKWMEINSSNRFSNRKPNTQEWIIRFPSVELNNAVCWLDSRELGPTMAFAFKWIL